MYILEICIRNNGFATLVTDLPKRLDKTSLSNVLQLARYTHKSEGLELLFFNGELTGSKLKRPSFGNSPNHLRAIYIEDTL